MKISFVPKASILRRFISLLILTVFILTACKPDKQSTLEPVQEPIIHYLLGDWPADFFIFMAEEKGYFKENNVPVQRSQGVGYAEVLEKKASTEIQYVWCYTLYDALIEKLTNAEPEMQIVYIQDYSSGADAVVAAADSGIKTIADLKGRTVGIEPNTVSEFFIAILLGREGLKLDDLEVVEVAAEDVPAALASGEIEAGVTFQPAISEAVGQGAVIIADSAQERGVVADVCVARKSHIDAHREVYKNYVKSILQAVDDYHKNPDEAIKIMKQAFNMDPVELKEILETLQIPNFRDHQTAFNRSSGFNSLFNTAKQAEQFLLEQGVIEETASFGDLFDANLF